VRVRACACVRARVCVHVCVRACARACVRVQLKFMALAVMGDYVSHVNPPRTPDDDGGHSPLEELDP
jgi:hypothetical protein